MIRQRDKGSKKDKKDKEKMNRFKCSAKKVINSKWQQNILTPVFVVGHHLDWFLTPEALQLSALVRTPACTTHYHSLHHIIIMCSARPHLYLTSWDFWKNQSLEFRFIIIYHFINTGNICEPVCVANFYDACKRTSLKFTRLVIKWFLYIPRLLYSPNCFNK